MVPASPGEPSQPAAPNNAGGASPTHQGATTAGNGALAGLEADPHAVHAPDLWPVAQSEPGDTYVVPQEPVPPPSTPTAADPVAADHPPANGGALGEIAATPPGAGKIDRQPLRKQRLAARDRVAMGETRLG